MQDDGTAGRFFDASPLTLIMRKRLNLSDPEDAWPKLRLV